MSLRGGVDEIKSDDYTCRTARRRLADGGSNPPSSTNTLAQLLMQLEFFFVSPRVHKGSSGFLRTSTPRVSLRKRLFSVSPDHFALQSRCFTGARSPQRHRFEVIKINNLRADASSGCFLASVGSANRPDSASGECNRCRASKGRFRPEPAVKHYADINPQSAPPVLPVVYDQPVDCFSASLKATFVS